MPDSPRPDGDPDPAPTRGGWHDFAGPNLAFALEAWRRWRDDERAVDARTARLLRRLGPPPSALQRGAAQSVGGDGDGDRDAADGVDPTAVAGVVKLAHAIRDYGHLAADLDPLDSEPPGDPSLDPAHHGLRAAKLPRLPATLIDGPCAAEAADADEAISRLRAAYSGTIGHDHRQVRVPEERRWLAEAAESRRFAPGALDEARGASDWRWTLLERLSQVEAFEQFLHRIFPGRHRFSIEGLDMLVPMLDELVCLAADSPARSLLLGMAHRGRLSVMTHVLGRPYREILAELKDPLRAWGVGAREDLGWSGDVKYHHGAYQVVRGEAHPDLQVRLLPNPSHLEFVNPVVQGMARAAGTSVAHGGPPEFDPTRSLPVAVHGDAAFPAQGIVAETLNLSRIPGWRTGGTIHIIANNQIGFTTDPFESRSTLFASDLAKGFRMPILHVNADDPAACIEVVRIAHAYRVRFAKDVLIDLVGYRRYGHNEGDEPRFTQPRMYARIDKHPRVRSLWSQRLVEAGVIEAPRAEALLETQRGRLQDALAELDPAAVELGDPGKAAVGRAEQEPPTGVPLERLRALHEQLQSLPDGFQPHPKIQRARAARAEALAEPDETTIDWAMAEELALASIAADGTAVRLTGEDSERGTFSHRHAVLHDVERDATHVPLQALSAARAACEVRNSPLSEVAAIGFEYGYNVQAPERLVLWEAQYGDFANVAQVIFDEFVFSGRAKWGLTPSLVFLLPHGHEGAGPDHSSARPERFLQLAADHNLRLYVPSTADQYFHMLRRQAALLDEAPLPLVVLTPKSLLRAASVRATPRSLAEGAWRPVIDDPRPTEARDGVRRLVLCAGKVGLDLLGDERFAADGPVAVARLEQLYPFPEAALRELLADWPSVDEVVWVQEEPANMGFWDYLRPRLRELGPGRRRLRFMGRPRSASPAEGLGAWHAENQADLLRHALVLDAEREEGDLVAHVTD